MMQVAFDFEPQVESEIAVKARDLVYLMAPMRDDPQWSIVRSESGSFGLVPTAYLGEPQVSLEKKKADKVREALESVSEQYEDPLESYQASLVNQQQQQPSPLEKSASTESKQASSEKAVHSEPASFIPPPPPPMPKSPSTPSLESMGVPPMPKPSPAMPAVSMPTAAQLASVKLTASQQSPLIKKSEQAAPLSPRPSLNPSGGAASPPKNQEGAAPQGPLIQDKPLMQPPKQSPQPQQSSPPKSQPLPPQQQHVHSPILLPKAKSVESPPQQQQSPLLIAKTSPLPFLSSPAKASPPSPSPIIQKGPGEVFKKPQTGQTANGARMAGVSQSMASLSVSSSRRVTPKVPPPLQSVTQEPPPGAAPASAVEAPPLVPPSSPLNNPWAKLRAKPEVSKTRTRPDIAAPSPPKSNPTPTRPDPAETRLWNDRTGRFQVEAQYLCLENDDDDGDDGTKRVRLWKLNGKSIAVPLAMLSDRDIEFVFRREGLSTVGKSPDSNSPSRHRELVPSATKTQKTNELSKNSKARVFSQHFEHEFPEIVTAVEDADTGSKSLAQANERVAVTRSVALLPTSGQEKTPSPMAAAQETLERTRTLKKTTTTTKISKEAPQPLQQLPQQQLQPFNPTTLHQPHQMHQMQPFQQTMQQQPLQSVVIMPQQQQQQQVMQMQPYVNAPTQLPPPPSMIFGYQQQPPPMPQVHHNVFVTRYTVSSAAGAAAGSVGARTLPQPPPMQQQMYYQQPLPQQQQQQMYYQQPPFMQAAPPFGAAGMPPPQPLSNPFANPFNYPPRFY